MRSRRRTLEGVDAASFEAFDQTYAKDSSTVFVDGANTFQLVYGRMQPLRYLVLTDTFLCNSLSSADVS